MSDTTNYTDEQEIVDQKAIELAEDFSYDGYQVVRRELFAHLREPAVVIRRDSVTFNTACIAGLEDAVYIQILVNQENKRMVVRKCEENDKDALRWCVAKPDKRKSRKMTNSTKTIPAPAVTYPSAFRENGLKEKNFFPLLR